MQELIPVALGGLIGLGVQAVRSIRLRIGLLVVLCLVVGALVSFATGELEVSLGFVSIDALLVWLGALIAVTLATLWRRRRITP